MISPAGTGFVAAAVAAASIAGAGDATIVPLGLGSYFDGLPPDAERPTNTLGVPIDPRVSDGFSGVPQTNEFWSSWIFPHFPSQPHGSLIHPHPLVVRAINTGLGISHTPAPSFVLRGYSHPLNIASTVVAGVQGLNAAEIRTASYGDWHVRGEWPDGAETMYATIGHGLPVVTLEADESNIASVQFFGPISVFADLGDTLGFTMGEVAFGLFAPGDWTLSGTGSGDTASAPLVGRGAYAVAVLPDAEPATLELFGRHAFSRVDDTRVSWEYDPVAGEVAVTHTFETTSLDGSNQPPLVALYRHQWLNSDQPTFASYASSRGEMKLTASDSFVCRFPFRGVLPALPDVGAFEPGRLETLIDEAENDGYNLGSDTYYSGKGIQKAAVLAPIAEQAGDTVARDTFLDVARHHLGDWFDAGSGSRYFAYDPNWRTLLGMPDSFGSARAMNDHHFHYGHFIHSAALLAMHDPDWAAGYAGMVELLIRDVANWDRGDARFPFLRNFDPYAGHSWASGNSAFDTGNNQESSSESMNFATGLILWGSVMGRDDIRDLGVYLHASEAAAIEQYWFDADDAVFPESLSRPLAGILWSDGAVYDTWWTENPEEIHGINFLPVTGGSLYLGRRPDAILDNWNLVLDQNGGPPDQWAGILWSGLATAHPALALEQFEAFPNRPVESGDSRARTEHWIRTLAATGPVDPAVWADAPTAAAFSDGIARTYAAWNPGPAEAVVRFSDGHAMLVTPGDLASDRRGVCPADLAEPFGELGGDDVGAFVAAFRDVHPLADLDRNGLHDLADVTAYVGLYAQGCDP